MSFNPLIQGFVLLTGNGTKVHSKVPAVDDWFSGSVKDSFVLGDQFGISIAMLIVVMVCSRPDKRRTPIFWLNILCLILAAVRAVLSASYYLTGWNEFYIWVAADYNMIGANKGSLQVLTLVIGLIFDILVVLNLAYQAYTVLKGASRKSTLILYGASAFVVLVFSSIHAATAILNAIAIRQATSFYSYGWLLKLDRVCECLLVWWFMGTFVWKLVSTVMTRQRMGFRRMNYFQILITGGAGVMFLPSVLAIIDLCDVPWLPQIGSLTLPMIAFLLPLMSLRASMQMKEFDGNVDASNLRAGSGPYNAISASNSLAPLAATGNSYTTDRRGSATPSTNPSTMNGPPPYVAGAHGHAGTDIELRNMGIQVNRSFGVRGDNTTGRLDV